MMTDHIPARSSLVLVAPAHIINTYVRGHSEKVSTHMEKKLEPSEENVYYLYQRIGCELGEELSTLEKLTDLIQIFKDNNLLALREIYEKNRREEKSKGLHSNVG